MDGLRISVFQCPFKIFHPILYSEEACVLGWPQVREALHLCSCSYMWSIEAYYKTLACATLVTMKVMWKINLKYTKKNTSLFIILFSSFIVFRFLFFPFFQFFLFFSYFLCFFIWFFLLFSLFISFFLPLYRSFYCSLSLLYSYVAFFI